MFRDFPAHNPTPCFRDFLKSDPPHRQCSIQTTHILSFILINYYLIDYNYKLTHTTSLEKYFQKLKKGIQGHSKITEDILSEVIFTYLQSSHIKLIDIFQSSLIYECIAHPMKQCIVCANYLLHVWYIDWMFCSFVRDFFLVKDWLDGRISSYLIYLNKVLLIDVTILKHVFKYLPKPLFRTNVINDPNVNATAKIKVSQIV